MLLNWVTRLLLLVVGIHTVLSRTVTLTTRGDKTSDILPRSAPIFLAYTDAYDGKTGPPDVSKIKVRGHRLALRGEVAADICGY